MSIAEAVLEKLKALPPNKQQEILDFAEFLCQKYLCQEYQETGESIDHQTPVTKAMVSTQNLMRE